MGKLLYFLLVMLVVGAVWLTAWHFADLRRKIGTIPFIILTLAVYTAIFFASFFFTLYVG